MTRRYALLVVAVAAGLALAGCIGGDGGDAMDGNASMNGTMENEDALDNDGAMEEGGAMEDDDGAMTNDSTDDGAMEDDGAMSSTASTLTLDVQSLPTLDEGVYEGWAIDGDEKVSTGTFHAGDDLSFDVDRDLAEADSIMVTVEPQPDDDPAPSGVVLLQGAVEDGTADLAFPVDLANASGSYILATPTNGADSQETAGVWFLDVPDPSPALELPTLGDGWSYEGWAVTQGQPVTSGRFDAPSGADDFDGYSGDQAAPPFPGEDFLRNAPDDLDFPADLADGSSRIVVSVEPDVDGEDPTGPAPFQIKPLVGDVPADADDHTDLDLQRNLDGVPSGTATIHHDGATTDDGAMDGDDGTMEDDGAMDGSMDG